MIIATTILGVGLLITIAVLVYLTLNKNNKPLGLENTNNKDAEVIVGGIETLKQAIIAMDAKNQHANQTSQQKLEAITRVMTDKKARGRYGEVQLETILNDAYGEQSIIVKKQQKLAKGGLVDIALDIEGQGLLPIDAKFPMEYYLNIAKATDQWSKEQAVKMFENQMKEHIRKVSDYIDVKETTPFALIFIPSESIFAEIQSNQTLLDESAKRKTYFSSPTSLLATIAVANQIKSQNDRLNNLPKIIKGLETIQKHMDTYKKSWEAIEKSIEKAYESTKTHGNKVSQVYNKADEILRSRDAKKLLEGDDDE